MKLMAYVWWCGDEVCDCTMPVIVPVKKSPHVSGWFVNGDNLWEGTFRSGYGGAGEELARSLQVMEEHWPAVYGRIVENG